MEEKNSFSVQSIVYDYLTSNRKEYDSTKSFHVSDMGRCPRMRILKRMGYKPSAIPPRSLARMEVGNVNHGYIQNIFRRKGMLIAQEGRVWWPFYELSGRFDIITKPPHSSLIELKNTHSRKILYGTIDRHYILQALTYLLLIQNKYHIYKARIALISRDDWIIGEENFFLTPTWLKEIYKDISTLKHWWMKKEIPPEKVEVDWECGYCGFVEYCPNVVEQLKKKKEKKKNGTITPKKKNG